MFTDTELGMAHCFGQRIRQNTADAQAIINRIHRDLQAERTAHRSTAVALQEALRQVARLQRQLDEVDALLN